MQRLLFYFLSMFLAATLNAQEVSDTIEVEEIIINTDYDIFQELSSENMAEGTVSLFQDPLLKVVVNRKINEDRKCMGLDGFRILIYTDNAQNSRVRSLEVVEACDTLFPQMPNYREYQNPNFKVYLGDYREKIDAIPDLKIVKRKYRDAYIVPDKIYFPKLN